MHLATNLLIAAVAALHLYFLILEMFLWQRPLGMKVFRTTPEQARATAPLAANQGLYNGFLVAGLIWSLVAGEPFRHSLAVFFLLCVLAAGLFGAATVSRRILVVQALPAAVALLTLLL
jgi:putative membrane protein